VSSQSRIALEAATISSSKPLRGAPMSQELFAQQSRVRRAIVAYLLVALVGTDAMAQAKVDSDLSKGSLRPWPLEFKSFLGPPQPPCPDRTCAVPVTVYRGTIQGLDACVATLPTETKLSSRLLTKIVWTLSPPTIADSTFGDADYEFEVNNGILVVEDNDFQMDMRSGRHGRGDGSALTATQFFFFHLNSRRNKEVTYLPVILQKNRKTGLVSLCGAVDPRIFND
jgi:hypothetical protein